MSRCSRSAFRSMMSRKRMPSGVSPSASPLISSLNETIEVSGVRSSCDTMARNWFRTRRPCAAVVLLGQLLLDLLG